MNRKGIENIVSAHADALNRNQVATDKLVNSQTDIPAELASLLQIASAVKTGLSRNQEAVRPSPIFRAKLRQELESFEPSEIKIGQSVTRQRSRWLAIAGAGSALSVLGIFLLVWRWLAGRRLSTDDPLKVAAAVRASAPSI
jgi:hypothetical protein